ncbi:MAG TPA: STAS domain-containing protein [Solirubrobacteraceae bacterium]|nr:STAS domain-containing protein [Solirubrobacteraceae bacterium]
MSVNGRGATAPTDTKLNHGDQGSLREFWEVYEAQFSEVGAELSEDTAAHPELANFVGAGSAQHVAEIRGRISQAINDDDWEPYLSDMIDTGARYAEAGLSFSAWFAAGRALRFKLVPRLIDALSDEPERLADALRGLSIFIDLVLLAVGDSFIDAKQRIILEQQDVLRGLSTPVLELRDGLLLVPLVGFIDSERALLLTGKLLEAIAATRAKAVVLDITGVPAVDSAVANHLMQTVQATQLMGAHTLISGLSPENAQTLVRLGLDLARLNTVGTLADGVLAASEIIKAAEMRLAEFGSVFGRS